MPSLHHTASFENVGIVHSLTKSLSRSCCQFSCLINSPSFIYTNVHFHVHKSHLLRTFLSQLKPFNTLTRHFVTSIIIQFVPVTASDLSVLASQIILLIYFSPPIRATCFRQPILLDLISPKYLIQRSTHTWYFLGNYFYFGFSLSFYVQIFPPLARHTDEVQQRTSVIWHYLLVWQPLTIGNRYIASPVNT